MYFFHSADTTLQKEQGDRVMILVVITACITSSVTISTTSSTAGELLQMSTECDVSSLSFYMKNVIANFFFTFISVLC